MGTPEVADEDPDEQEPLVLDDDEGAESADSDLEPRWGVVGNVVAERLVGPDWEVRQGTKHFSGGAKVYFVDGYWGMGGESITVLGLCRRPQRWIKIDLRTRLLENWRAKVIYAPAVLRRLPPGPDDEAEARRMAAGLEFISAADRVRLIEVETPRVDRAAEQAEGTGNVVLRATCDWASRPTDPTGFVLVDGASPIAGATTTTAMIAEVGGHRTLASVWVARDWPDALASLFVHARHRQIDTYARDLTNVITQIQLARRAATAIDKP